MSNSLQPPLPTKSRCLGIRPLNPGPLEAEKPREAQFSGQIPEYFAAGSLVSLLISAIGTRSFF